MSSFNKFPFKEIYLAELKKQCFFLHSSGPIAQLVEQLTFNQLVAGSNPARPTNVKRCPKGAFLLCTEFKDSNLQQVRVERSETALRQQRPEGRGEAELSCTTHQCKKAP